MFGLLVVVLAGAGLGTYFVTDGKAKDSAKAPRGTPAIPVTVARVEQLLGG